MMLAYFCGDTVVGAFLLEKSNTYFSCPDDLISKTFTTSV